MTREQALRATRHGAYVGFFIAAITGAVAAYAISTDGSSGALASYNHSSVFDALLYLICGISLYFRQSRVSAIAMAVCYVGERLFITTASDTPEFSWISLVCLFFMARAIYGAFVYQRYEKQGKKISKWVYAAVTPFVFIFGALAIYAGCLITGVVPVPYIMTEAQMRDSDIDRLIQNRIVSSKEKIDYFFSDGRFSILERGNVLTDKRLVTYHRNSIGEVEVNDLLLANITHVELTKPGNTFSYSHYDVHSRKGRSLELSLPGNETDVFFLERLQERIASVKKRYRKKSVQLGERYRRKS